MVKQLTLKSKDEKHYSTILKLFNTLKNLEMKELNKQPEIKRLEGLKAIKLFFYKTIFFLKI